MTEKLFQQKPSRQQNKDEAMMHCRIFILFYFFFLYLTLHIVFSLGQF